MIFLDLLKKKKVFTYLTNQEFTSNLIAEISLKTNLNCDKKKKTPPEDRY